MLCSLATTPSPSVPPAASLTAPRIPRQDSRQFSSGDREREGAEGPRVTCDVARGEAPARTVSALHRVCSVQCWRPS